jgi:hypothetical protein
VPSISRVRLIGFPVTESSWTRRQRFHCSPKLSAYPSSVTKRGIPLRVVSGGRVNSAA